MKTSRVSFQFLSTFRHFDFTAVDAVKQFKSLALNTNTHLNGLQEEEHQSSSSIADSSSDAVVTERSSTESSFQRPGFLEDRKPRQNLPQSLRNIPTKHSDSITELSSLCSQGTPQNNSPTFPCFRKLAKPHHQLFSAEQLNDSHDLV